MLFMKHDPCSLIRHMSTIIEEEGKAKVVAAGWRMELNAALIS